jgi:hypothetical protein
VVLAVVEVVETAATVVIIVVIIVVITMVITMVVMAMAAVLMAIEAMALHTAVFLHMVMHRDQRRQLHQLHLPSNQSRFPLTGGLFNTQAVSCWI